MILVLKACKQTLMCLSSPLSTRLFTIPTSTANSINTARPLPTNIQTLEWFSEQTLTTIECVCGGRAVPQCWWGTQHLRAPLCFFAPPHELSLLIREQRDMTDMLSVARNNCHTIGVNISFTQTKKLSCFVEMLCVCVCVCACMLFISFTSPTALKIKRIQTLGFDLFMAYC